MSRSGYYAWWNRQANPGRRQLSRDKPDRLVFDAFHARKGRNGAVGLTLDLALSSPHVWIQPVIAQSEGYFKEVGLEVKIVRFTSGRAAMDALIGGQANLATTAISPVILASFQNQPMAILAENARFLEEKITARLESGITEPADLAGKKIGVKLGTDIHYFLHLFLKHAGLSIEDIQIVNLRPPDMVISLVRGDVDAFASWKPHPDKAKAAMGDKAIFLTEPDPPIFESLCESGLTHYIDPPCRHPSCQKSLLTAGAA